MEASEPFCVQLLCMTKFCGPTANYEIVAFRNGACANITHPLCYIFGNSAVDK